MPTFSIMLQELVQLLWEKERPVGIVLEDEAMLAQALSAPQFFSGYGTFDSLLPEVTVEAVIPIKERELWVTFSSFPHFSIPIDPFPVGGFVESDTRLTQS